MSNYCGFEKKTHLKYVVASIMHNHFFYVLDYSFEYFITNIFLLHFIFISIHNIFKKAFES